MCPCFRLYAAAGWRLQQAILAQQEKEPEAGKEGVEGQLLYLRSVGDSETGEAGVKALEGHQFKKWIETYGGAEFEVSRGILLCTGC